MGSGAAAASWTLSGLNPGDFRVSVTWQAHTNRATDAPYTVLDGSTELATVTVTNKVSTGGGVAMAGNVLVGGILGAGIDAGTGAMLDLTPNPAHVDLSQERAPATGRPE